MIFADLIGNAFANLRRRKLRSFLTIFAVVIGAGLVALLVSVGIGMQQFLDSQVRAVLPPNVAMVASSQAAFEFASGFQFGSAPPPVENGETTPFVLEPLTPEAIAAVEAFPEVEQTDPYIIIFSTTTLRLPEGDRYRIMLRPRPEYQLRLTPLIAGDYFEDDTRGSCILAGQFLDALNIENRDDIIGREVIIEVTQALTLIGLPAETREYSFTVVGVTERTLASTVVSISVEDGKEIARFWADNSALYTDEIPPAVLMVRTNTEEDALRVAEQARDMGLGSMTSADILGIIGTIFGVMQAILAAFGLIALAVAALTIVNTLIMSVYERTREIGVMKALGASRGVVRSLLTVEGAAIGLLGGIIGVGIAYGLGFLINRVAHATFFRDFPMFSLSVMPWWLILGVIVLATVIALVAALYPANRAAGLDPIEALRYE
ncbi:MAG: ABC transporter permease [Dehalococcoidia bacterium]|nr:ABC transporter permease [Dehalococcoidia bacterium]